MNDFLQFLAEPIAQRSLWACGIIGFANGFVSALVVLRKSSLQIGTISCALLPGIALAILLFGLVQLSILVGAIIAGLLVGLGSLFLSRTSRIDHDAALSILHATAFAIGYIILVRLGLQQKVDDWLFGNIMSMGNADLWISYGVSAIAILSLTILQRPLLIYLFDARAAAIMGIPTRLFSYGIFALIILVLVSSLQAVGAFLTLGLMVAPAATMYLLTDKASVLFLGGRTHWRAWFHSCFLFVLSSGVASGCNHYCCTRSHLSRSLYHFALARYSTAPQASKQEKQTIVRDFCLLCHR